MKSYYYMYNVHNGLNLTEIKANNVKEAKEYVRKFYADKNPKRVTKKYAKSL